MKENLNREEVLELLRQHKPIMRERFGVTDIGLFGSFARDEATEDSDIDVAVEFDGVPSFANYFDAQVYIEGLVGRSVDLVRERNIRKEILPYVERDLIKV